MQQPILDPELTKKLFEFAHDVHTNHNTVGGNHIMRRDMYPYIVHPMWAACSLIMDPDIPKEERILGFQILVLHDVLEDTSVPLPEWVTLDVQDGVKKLSHDTWEQELEDIKAYTPFFKLLKLCDKMQTFYERGVDLPAKRPKWKQLIERLVGDVEAHYGKTRVIVIAKALLEDTDW